MPPQISIDEVPDIPRDPTFDEDADTSSSYSAGIKQPAAATAGGDSLVAAMDIVVTAPTPMVQGLDSIEICWIVFGPEKSREFWLNIHDAFFMHMNIKLKEKGFFNPNFLPKNF